MFTRIASPTIAMPACEVPMLTMQQFDVPAPPARGQAGASAGLI